MRLTIAACALVHCSAQIPSDSAQYSDAYTNAKMLEDLGNSAEFEAERTLLSKQYELMTDSWGAGVKKPLFDYNFAYAGLDYAAAKDSKYALMTRTGGALQAVGGAVTIVGSYSGAAATCVASSGLGCGLAAGAGSVGATIGADHLDTGVKTLIDGKAYPTTGAKLLSDVTGISLDNAELIYGVVPAERVISGLNSSSKLPVIGKTTDYPKTEFNYEAYNAKLYMDYKKQLQNENLSNIIKDNPMLEHAAFGNGNLTFGSLSRKESELLALQWVGDGAIKTSNGWISADGTRLYRAPDIKKYSQYAETGIQSNFQRGYMNESKFISESNLHINIKDN